jgi:hypothetical protein
VRDKSELCKNCENNIGNFVKTHGIKLRNIFGTSQNFIGNMLKIVDDVKPSMETEKSLKCG